MSDGKQPVQVQHKWLWAISPMNQYETAFVAHCRLCNSIFSQRLLIDMNPNFAKLSKVDLPEWGCVNPMATIIDGFGPQ